MNDDRIRFLFGDRSQQTKPEPQIDPLIPLPRVAKVFGVSGRTIDRWLARPEIGFPRPMKINGRRYLHLSEVVAFDEAKAKARGGEA